MGVPGYPIKDSVGYKQNRHAFMTLPEAKSAPEMAQMWREYLVFTVARNPYSRAGSAYDYILRERDNTPAGCAPPGFPAFAKKPHMLGVQDLLFHCNQNPEHDFHHVEPQAQCLTTVKGGSAVDFIVRYAFTAHCTLHSACHDDRVFA